jgi:23S rRNA G2445 N2-methylase RlmL
LYRKQVRVPYRYVTNWSDSSDFASGVVLRSAPGYPAFPARLAVEIFLRATSHLDDDRPVTLWDPCCGSGHLLTVLGWLQRARLRGVIGSDVSEQAVELARKNIALLTPEGLAARERERREPSYTDAAEAARRLAGRLTAAGGGLPGSVHQADVFDPSALETVLAGAEPPDVVLTDVPYSEQTHWAGKVPEQPVPAMLRSLASVLPQHAVVAVTSRGRRIAGIPLRPLERLKIGTRSVVLLRAGDIQGAGPGLSDGRDAGW